MNDIIVWLFIGFVARISIDMIYYAFKCNHEWEEVISNSNTVVYRCKKCGKEKRYTL